MWHSLNGDWDIYGQRYGLGGEQVGNNFVVNTNRRGHQWNPVGSMSPNGNFVVMWGSSIGGENIGGQRYDYFGNPTGDAFHANTDTVSSRGCPSVAVNGAGDLVVVWGVGGNSVYGQRYDASGDKVGEEFQVNTTDGSSKREPSVAMNNKGEFVVAWMDNGLDGDGWGIAAQVYDGFGREIGDEFVVNTQTSGSQTSPSIAMGDETYAVVWVSRDQSGAGVYGRVLSIPEPTTAVFILIGGLLALFRRRHCG